MAILAMPPHGQDAPISPKLIISRYGDEDS